MDWNEVEGNWKQLKGKVREQWGKLTDSELTEIAGKKDQLLGKIQERYGIAKMEAETQLKRWHASMGANTQEEKAATIEFKSAKTNIKK